MINLDVDISSRPVYSNTFVFDELTKLRFELGKHSFAGQKSVLEFACSACVYVCILVADF